MAKERFDGSNDDSPENAGKGKKRRKGGKESGPRKRVSLEDHKLEMIRHAFGSEEPELKEKMPANPEAYGFDDKKDFYAHLRAVERGGGQQEAQAEDSVGEESGSEESISSEKEVPDSSVPVEYKGMTREQRADQYLSDLRTSGDYSEADAYELAKEAAALTKKDVRMAIERARAQELGDERMATLVGAFARGETEQDMVANPEAYGFTDSAALEAALQLMSPVPASEVESSGPDASQQREELKKRKERKKKKREVRKEEAPTPSEDEPTSAEGGTPELKTPEVRAVSGDPVHRVRVALGRNYTPEELLSDDGAKAMGLEKKEIEEALETVRQDDIRIVRNSIGKRPPEELLEPDNAEMVGLSPERIRAALEVIKAEAAGKKKKPQPQMPKVSIVSGDPVHRVRVALGRGYTPEELLGKGGAENMGLEKEQIETALKTLGPEITRKDRQEKGADKRKYPPRTEKELFALLPKVKQHLSGMNSVDSTVLMEEFGVRFSQASQLLRQLEKEGFLRHHPDGHYSVRSESSKALFDRVKEHIAQTHSAQAEDLMKEFGVNFSEANNILRRLEKEGFLRRDARGRLFIYPETPPKSPLDTEERPPVRHRELRDTVAGEVPSFEELIAADAARKDPASLLERVQRAKREADHRADEDAFARSHSPDWEEPEGSTEPPTVSVEETEEEREARVAAEERAAERLEALKHNLDALPETPEYAEDREQIGHQIAKAELILSRKAKAEEAAEAHADLEEASATLREAERRLEKFEATQVTLKQEIERLQVRSNQAEAAWRTALDALPQPPEPVPEAEAKRVQDLEAGAEAARTTLERKRQTLARLQETGPELLMARNTARAARAEVEARENAVHASIARIDLLLGGAALAALSLEEPGEPDAVRQAREAQAAERVAAEAAAAEAAEAASVERAQYEQSWRGRAEAAMVSAGKRAGKYGAFTLKGLGAGAFMLAAGSLWFAGKLTQFALNFLAHPLKRSQEIWKKITGFLEKATTPGEGSKKEPPKKPQAQGT